MQLRLDNVRKEFGDKVAVDSLSLEVPEGVIYGIIGPNGAGKTTTIRMIMNITVPDSGQVLVDGKPVDRKFRNRVGYLPEERGLYRKMTALEVLVYLAELKSQPRSAAKAAARDWLGRIGIAEYANRKVEELSKGMQQKLQFVSTILHDPDLIILDELFSGLDPLNIELIKDILLEMKRKRKTILFSTHVMEQAEKLCDYVCMISRGRKVLDGKMTEVKSRFGKNSLHLEINGDGAFLADLPGVVRMIDFDHYRELTLAPGADPKAILRAALDRVEVLRFDTVEPSLYDIFIDLARYDPEKRSGGEAAGNE